MDLMWIVLGILFFYFFQLGSFIYRIMKRKVTSKPYYILTNVLNFGIFILSIPVGSLIAGLVSYDPNTEGFESTAVSLIVSGVPFLFFVLSLVDTMYIQKKYRSDK